MSSTYGENIHISVFGQSHSEAIGVVLDGIGAGLEINTDELNSFMLRRAPGRNEYSTARKEADEPRFLSGIINGRTTGAPIAAIIQNTNTRSGDYSAFENIPRPGHADYTARVKYSGFEDRAGGGHFSGRLTAPLCVAGGICKQLLEKEGIDIISRIYSIGSVCDEGELNESTAEKEFPTISDTAAEKMKREIAAAKADGDSVGGTIECSVLGLNAGLGGPMFGGMEGRISLAMFAVPAVKGIEFGAGFASSRMRGSENNDLFCLKDGKVVTKTNNCGGILGGITNGMPLTFRVAIKPTPSIAREQLTLNTKTLEQETLSIAGRHDPCIVPRAVPCIEAAAAIAVYDALLNRRAETK